jgi:class 3 adenylate cyclase
MLPVRQKQEQDRDLFTAIVKVTNLAARLCGEAKGGQILISAGVATACLPR